MTLKLLQGARCSADGFAVLSCILPTPRGGGAVIMPTLLWEGKQYGLSPWGGGGRSALWQQSHVTFTPRPAAGPSTSPTLTQRIAGRAVEEAYPHVSPPLPRSWRLCVHFQQRGPLLALRDLWHIVAGYVNPGTVAHCFPSWNTPDCQPRLQHSLLSLPECGRWLRAPPPNQRSESKLL